MKVLIFGSSGLVGSSLVRNLSNNSNLESIIASNRKDTNLFSIDETRRIIELHDPNIIINAAAKVGGILANNIYRTNFILSNLKININILESIIDKPNIKVINLGSSCIYPLNTKNPIKESALMTGPLEPTNSAYAMAKLSAIELGSALTKEFGHKIINLMPTNLYGPNDNFSDNESHVIPGLINRMHKAKINNETKFDVWGTGTPLREFLFVDDLSDAINFIINNEINIELLNVGSGFEVTINELANLIKTTIGYKGGITFNTNFPDGNPRKLLDTSKLNKLGWFSKTDLIEGLSKTYKWFLENK